MDKLPVEILAHEILGRVSAEEWKGIATVCRAALAAITELTKMKFPCRYKHIGDKTSDEELHALAMLLPARPSCYCGRFAEQVAGRIMATNWELLYSCFYCPITVSMIIEAIMERNPDEALNEMIPIFPNEMIEKNNTKFERRGGFTVRALGFSFAIGQFNTTMCDVITLLDCVYIVTRWRQELITDNRCLGWLLNMIFIDKAPRSTIYRVCLVRIVLLMLISADEITIDPAGPAGEFLVYCVEMMSVFGGVGAKLFQKRIHIIDH